MRYPLRIHFWYKVHDAAESLWHWVYRRKLAPWHHADRASRPQVPPTYHLIAEVEATDEPQRVEISPGVFVTSPTKASGVTKSRIYTSH